MFTENKVEMQNTRFQVLVSFSGGTGVKKAKQRRLRGPWSSTSKSIKRSQPWQPKGDPWRADGAFDYDSLCNHFSKNFVLCIHSCYLRAGTAEEVLSTRRAGVLFSLLRNQPPGRCPGSSCRPSPSKQPCPIPPRQPSPSSSRQPCPFFSKEILKIFSVEIEKKRISPMIR